MSEQWRIQVLKKNGARLHKTFKLTDFGLSFTLKKVKFVGKKGGAHAPAPLSKSATGECWMFTPYSPFHCENKFGPRVPTLF